MAEISISIGVFDDSLSTIVVSDHIPVSQVLPYILKALSPTSDSARLPLDQWKVLLARPVDMDKTLAELGIRTGDTLHIMATHIRASHVAIVLASPHHIQPSFSVRINRSPVILGVKRDEDKVVDIDLSSALPEDKRDYISRQQAELSEIDGTWRIALHENGRAQMFINDRRLLPGQALMLTDNSLISFGPNLSRPHFQLIVRLETA